MRCYLTLAMLLIASGAAHAQSFSVNKGQWQVSQDIYYEASAQGETLDLPSEHSSVDECWMRDDEVLIDESMVEMFEGCVSTGVSATEFGLEIGLACNFDGLDVEGSAQFSLSHGRDSFVAQVYMATTTTDPVDFQSHILMIGHRTGACKTPG